MNPLDRYLSAARLVTPLLESAAVRERWDEPSALTQWSVGGLAGHLVWSAINLVGALDAPTAEDAAPLDALAYFAGTPAPTAETAIGARIREKGDALAADGHAHVVERFGTSLFRLAKAREASASLERPVAMLGRVVTVGTFAETRVLELLVHADDLAVSVDASPIAYPDDLIQPTLELLLSISVRRHGSTGLLRTLSRDERAQRVAAF